MNFLNIEQKESIIRRITFIEFELEDLQKYKNIDFKTYESDRKTRRDVERIIENIVNACLDIGKILLAGEKFEVPQTYREVFIKLSEAKIITKKTGENLADFTKLRNILAHQYLDLKWEMIDKFISQGIETTEKFLDIIKEKI